MGEARRREARIFETKIPTDSTDLRDCVNRTLTMYADIFGAVLVIKEPEDDLLAWPAGAIVGMCSSDPRVAIEGGSAALKDVCRIEVDHYEFVLPDIALLSGHLTDMLNRGLRTVGHRLGFLGGCSVVFSHGSGRRLALRAAASEARALCAHGASGAFGIVGHDLVTAGPEAVQ